MIVRHLLAPAGSSNPWHCARTAAGGPGASTPTASWATAPRAYWTFAVTALFALRVKVQLEVLAPPLLQAPDQMALRPLEGVSLIELPTL